jgi:DNA-binding MarR family transcriptional regulator
MADEPGAKVEFGFLHDHVGFQINLCRRGVMIMQRSTEGGTGRKPTGYNSALALIGLNPRISQKRIATELFLDPQGVVLIIDKLEQAGLVTRSRSKQDRRVMELNLTEAGRAELRHVEEASERQEDRLAQFLSEDEQTHLIQLLNKVRRQLAAAG